MHVQIYKAVCLYDIENQLWLASALDISPPLPPPFFFFLFDESEPSMDGDQSQTVFAVYLLVHRFVNAFPITFTSLHIEDRTVKSV